MLISSTTQKVNSVSCEDFELPKREWVYVMPPRAFEIPGCSCGNDNVVYSEYKEHLWCANCQKDFEPEHWGIFDGPILFELSLCLGIHFDRVDLTRDVYQKCIIDDETNSIQYIDLAREEIPARQVELKKLTEPFKGVLSTEWLE